MPTRCDVSGCDRTADGFVDVQIMFGTGKLPLCARHHPEREEVA
jgi:hypothetical protein